MLCHLLFLYSHMVYKNVKEQIVKASTENNIRKSHLQLIYSDDQNQGFYLKNDRF